MAQWKLRENGIIKAPIGATNGGSNGVLNGAAYNDVQSGSYNGVPKPIHAPESPSYGLLSKIRALDGPVEGEPGNGLLRSYR
jgi:hypothetical protein